MTELADRRLVRDKLVTQVYAKKPPHGLYLVEACSAPELSLNQLCSKWIQSIRSSPKGGLVLPRLGLERLDEGTEFLPGSALFRIGQKLLPPFFVLLGGHGIGKVPFALDIKSSPEKIWSISRLEWINQSTCNHVVIGRRTFLEDFSRESLTFKIFQ